MIVLKPVVDVPREQHAAGCRPSTLWKGLLVERRQNICSRRAARSLTWSAEDFSQSVRWQASAQHVTHVAVPETCCGEGRRRWVGVVTSVAGPFCSGERWVIWLRRSPAVPSASRHNGGCMSSLGLRWRLAVVQVGMWRRLWRLRGSLVSRKN